MVIWILELLCKAIGHRLVVFYYRVFQVINFSIALPEQIFQFTNFHDTLLDIN